MNKCPDILKKIVETKKEEICALSTFLREFKLKAAESAAPLDFQSALCADSLAVIAEVKKASPSAGIISDNFNPSAAASAYSEGGADAVSVLTDCDYFKGDIAYLAEIRTALPDMPLLRKDFIIDELQIYEARANGADSFLLISAILETPQMRDFIALGRDLGMEPLVESHNEWELEKTLEAGALIFGINNRNLHDFTVDIATSERLRSMIPGGSTAVSESGIHTGDDAARMKAAGYNAVLVGESLMRKGEDKCGELIAAFRNAASADFSTL